MTMPPPFGPPSIPSGALALPPLPLVSPSAPSAGCPSVSSAPLTPPPTASSWGDAASSCATQVLDTTCSLDPVDSLTTPRSRDTVKAPCRDSTAFMITVLSLAGCLALLEWGSCDLVASVGVLDVITRDAPIINKTDVLMIGIGAVLAAVACVFALVATIRWRPIAVPAILLVLALVLPLAVTVVSFGRGGEAFKTRNLANIPSCQESATEIAEAVDAEQAEATFNRLETFGITVPCKEEIIEAPREAQQWQAEP